MDQTNSPRATLSRIIKARVHDPVETQEALQALAALRDPPSPDAGAAFLAPGPKAVRRNG
jgi:hypothetical protein